MASIMKLVIQLTAIEKECSKNKKLNDELEKYVLATGNPATYNDALAFIKEYERVKESIKNTG